MHRQSFAPLDRTTTWVSTHQGKPMRRHMQYVMPYILIGIAATAPLAAAQTVEEEVSRFGPNASYDGRYAFARLLYVKKPDDPCNCPVGETKGETGCLHDFPKADLNLMHITAEVTDLIGRTDSTVTFKADNPQIMKYPILYLSEPACYRPSESEVLGLRKYLLKGGFLIVDDFTICTGGSIRFETSRRIFEDWIKKVLPGSQLVPVEWTDPALNEFYRLNPALVKKGLMHTSSDLPPQVYGIYERNDPTRRIMVEALYYGNEHRTWDYLPTGAAAVNPENEAFKLGVNYLLYGFTH